MGQDVFATIVGGGTAGLITFLLAALMGVLKGWWVPGYIFRALEAKLARYEDFAFKAVGLLERNTAKDGTP